MFIRKTVGATESVLYGSRKNMDSWKRVGREPPFREDLSPEAGE
jgi:hypothetical protein